MPAWTMDDSVQKIHDRRRRKPTERWQFAVNTLAVLLLAVPMIIESLKELMPAHFYGVVSSVVAVLNAAVGVWREWRSRHDVRID